MNDREREFGAREVVLTDKNKYTISSPFFHLNDPLVSLFVAMKWQCDRRWIDG